MAFRIKLSSKMRPYVGRVVTSGAVQKAFAAHIGKPAGACVKSGVKKGMSGTAIRKVVHDCGKNFSGFDLKSKISAFRSK